MIVYAVHKGWVYDGGNIRAVFSTKEKAREYALAIIANQDFDANVNHQSNQLMGWGNVDCKMTVEVAEDRWEQGDLIIKIETMVVDDLTPPFKDLETERQDTLNFHKQTIEDYKKENV